MSLRPMDDPGLFDVAAPIGADSFDGKLNLLLSDFGPKTATYPR
jgi:hypothetical protein